MNVLVAQPCPTLWDPMYCSSPCSSLHGIFQTRILKWVAIPFSKGSSQPRNRTQFAHIAGRFFPPQPSSKPSLRAIDPTNTYLNAYHMPRAISNNRSIVMNLVETIHVTNNIRVKERGLVKKKSTTLKKNVTTNGRILNL